MTLFLGLLPTLLLAAWNIYGPRGWKQGKHHIRGKHSMAVRIDYRGQYISREIWLTRFRKVSKFRHGARWQGRTLAA